jgi:hypothetical protein
MLDGVDLPTVFVAVLVSALFCGLGATIIATRRVQRDIDLAETEIDLLIADEMHGVDREYKRLCR